MRRILALLAVLSSACTFKSDLGGATVLCDPGGRCPDGRTCVEEVCLLDDEIPDAGAPNSCPTSNVVAKTIGTNAREFATIQSWENARGGGLVDRQLLLVEAGSGSFTPGETVTSASCSGVFVAPDDAGTNGPRMSLDGVTGTCAADELLTGESSGATATFKDLCFEGVIEEGRLFRDSAFGDNVVIAGSTTDAGHFMRLTVAPGQRHNGLPGGGAVLAPVAAGHGILIQDDFTQVSWVEITDWTTDSGGSFDGINIKANNVLVENVIIHRDGHGAELNSDANGVTLERDDMTATVRNSLIFAVARSGIAIWNVGGATLYVENCTTFRCVREDPSAATNGCIVVNGDMNKAESVLIAKNVIAMDAEIEPGGLDFFAGDNGVFDLTNSSNNLSSDASAPGADSLIGQNSLDVFVSRDLSALDVHLKSGSPAIDNGADLSASFTTDFDDETRTAPWDIGADESP